MSFGVLWFPQPRKYLEKLPEDIAARIFAKVQVVSTDPFRYLESFEGELYKLRIGEYRALVDVDFEKKLLRIRVFDKRERIY